MRGNRPFAADQPAIPVDLVSILDVGKKRSQPVRARLRRAERDVIAIPPEAFSIPVPLPAPWPVRRQLLPSGIIEFRRGPRGIVPDVKLPRAVELG